jgi:hypothetical protein
MPHQSFKQLALAPLDAVNVFFGGDDWFTLFAQPMPPPKHLSAVPNQSLVKPYHLFNPL